MQRIFVTRRIPEAGLELLEREGPPGLEVVVGEEDDQTPLPRRALLEGVREADVLVSLLTEPVDRPVLEAGVGLRGVANYAVGYDNVDVEAATELGLPVTNTPGVLTESTADLTWALVLAAARRVPEGDRFTREGRFRTWGPRLLLGLDVGPGPDGTRRTLGVVGFGRIGQAVARRARGFDMEVLAHRPGGRERIEAHPDAAWAEWDEILERSDVVTLHVPLGPETRHLVGEPELRRMKETAVLVNTSRGPVVDERALVRALSEGWIAAAGLDVYEEEPELAPGLAELPNAVLAPHIGSATRETRDRMATIAARNALHHLRGETAPEAVNPEVYGTAAWRERVGPAEP